MDKTQGLLTTAQVAEMTGVSENTLRWWRHVGEGPASFRIGRRKVAYRRDDVDAWLRRQYEATVQGGVA